MKTHLPRLQLTNEELNGEPNEQDLIEQDPNDEDLNDEELPPQPTIPAATLAGLPNELLFPIAKYVRNHNIGDSQAMGDLASLALVSRALNAPATEALYLSPHIAHFKFPRRMVKVPHSRKLKWPKSRNFLFARTLLEAPELFRWTQGLHLGITIGGEITRGYINDARSLMQNCSVRAHRTLPLEQPVRTEAYFAAAVFALMVPVKTLAIHVNKEGDAENMTDLELSDVFNDLYLTTYRDGLWYHGHLNHEMRVFKNVETLSMSGADLCRAFVFMKCLNTLEVSNDVLLYNRDHTHLRQLVLGKYPKNHNVKHLKLRVATWILREVFCLFNPNSIEFFVAQFPRLSKLTVTIVGNQGPYTYLGRWHPTTVPICEYVHQADVRFLLLRLSSLWLTLDCLVVNVAEDDALTTWLPYVHPVTGLLLFPHLESVSFPQPFLFEDTYHRWIVRQLAKYPFGTVILPGLRRLEITRVEPRINLWLGALVAYLEENPTDLREVVLVTRPGLTRPLDIVEFVYNGLYNQSIVLTIQEPDQ